MENWKNETYMEKLLKGKDFKEKFEKEYQNLLTSEKTVKKIVPPLKKGVRGILDQ